MRITKAIIPAAGLGTRFLPVTKVVAKELLPILEKPAIHYIAQEALDASLNQLCLIISKDKQAIRHYFEPTEPSLQTLINQKKIQYRLDQANALIDKGSFSYITQDQPLGLGHAVSLARDFVDHEFCAVLLPDDILVGKKPAIGQLIDIALHKNATVLAVMKVPPDQVSRYGIVRIKQQLSDTLFTLNHIVEKPAVSDAPSCYAVIGRYVLSPAIFDALARIKPGAQQELQLTDALADLIAHDHELFALVVDHQRFDTGTPYGWLEANCYFAKQDQAYAPLFSPNC